MLYNVYQEKIKISETDINEIIKQKIEVLKNYHNITTKKEIDFHLNKDSNTIKEVVYWFSDQHVISEELKTSTKLKNIGYNLWSYSSPDSNDPNNACTGSYWIAYKNA
jgi:hypothetical protein